MSNSTIVLTVDGHEGEKYFTAASHCWRELWPGAVLQGRGRIDLGRGAVNMARRVPITVTEAALGGEARRQILALSAGDSRGARFVAPEDADYVAAGGCSRGTTTLEAEHFIVGDRLEFWGDLALFLELLSLRARPL